MKTQKQKDYNKISQRLCRIWKNLVNWISNIDGFEILLYFLYTIVGFLVVLMFALLFKTCKEATKIEEEEQTKTITEEKSPEIKWKIDTVFVLPSTNSTYEIHFKATDQYDLNVIRLDTVDVGQFSNHLINAEQNP
jgi:hypothetical protein